ncbi:hypothetical protein ACP70R_000995 [Stipagrostis hirtigluma subsp. patula]
MSFLSIPHAQVLNPHTVRFRPPFSPPLHGLPPPIASQIPSLRSVPLHGHRRRHLPQSHLRSSSPLPSTSSSVLDTRSHLTLSSSLTQPPPILPSDVGAQVGGPATAFLPQTRQPLPASALTMCLRRERVVTATRRAPATVGRLAFPPAPHGQLAAKVGAAKQHRRPCRQSSWQCSYTSTPWWPCGG